MMLEGYLFILKNRILSFQGLFELIRPIILMKTMLNNFLSHIPCCSHSLKSSIYLIVFFLFTYSSQLFPHASNFHFSLVQGSFDFSWMFVQCSLLSCLFLLFLIEQNLSGEKLTVQYLQKNGFNKPIMVKHRDHLSLEIPPKWVCPHFNHSTCYLVVYLPTLHIHTNRQISFSSC